MAGGAGASYGNSKTAMSLGKQLSKRVFNTGEVKKAVAYYGKNMINGAKKPIYTSLTKALLKSGGTSLGCNSVKSIFARFSQ